MTYMGHYAAEQLRQILFLRMIEQQREQERRRLEARREQEHNDVKRRVSDRKDSQA